MKIACKLLAVLAVLSLTTTAYGQITDSPHDMRASSSGTNQNITGLDEICLPCHVPHNALKKADGLLWNHEYTTTTGWTFYNLTGDMTGESKVCLGCHDGVTGIDNYGAVGGSIVMSNTATVVGGGTKDLSGDHPIGIAYPSSGDFNTATEAETAGVKLPTVSSIKRVECTSCHEPHDTTTGNGKFQRITTVGSELCKACHDK